MTSRIVVIAVGNRFRRDDGVGPAIMQRIASELPPGAITHETDGEPSRLIDAWAGADLALVVESVRSGAAPGTIIDLEADDLATGDPGSAGAGTHSLGFADAIALGRAVDRMPRRLRLVGIEAEDFAYGEGLSDAVALSVPAASEIVLDHVRAALEG